jgi:hypothetical protein
MIFRRSAPRSFRLVDFDHVAGYFILGNAKANDLLEPFDAGAGFLSLSSFPFSA